MISAGLPLRVQDLVQNLLQLSGLLLVLCRSLCGRSLSPKQPAGRAPSRPAHVGGGGGGWGVWGGSGQGLWELGLRVQDLGFIGPLMNFRFFLSSPVGDMQWTHGMGCGHVIQWFYMVLGFPQDSGDIFA